MNSNVATGLIVLLLLAVAILGWLLWMRPAVAPTLPQNTTQQGATSTTTVGTPSTSTPLHDRVFVTSPKSGETLGHTIVVSGEAPGPWYFEASFPLQVRDMQGAVLGQAPAQAQGDWMTEGQVPFKGTVQIISSFHGPALLILMKDNPSGLPEHDDAVEVPIVVQ